MTSLSFFLPILISTFLIPNIPTAFSVQDTYLSSNCTNGHLPANTTTVRYAADVKALLDILQGNTTALGGFQYSSYGGAFGLALCRGDVSNKSCVACLHNATAKLNETCPAGGEAIVWYDFCLLKYSNQNFSGKLDMVNRFARANTNDTGDINFNTTTIELLKYLSNEAADKKGEFFAMRPLLHVQGNDTLYAMVQCSLDLTKEDCRKCLFKGAKYMSQYLADRVSAIFECGSCLLRYSTNPFFNNI